MTFEDGADGERDGFVADEVGLDEDGFGAEALGGDGGKGRADPEATGFGRGGADDGTLALPGDDDGFTTEGWVIALLDGSVEGVHIDMNDFAQLGWSCERVCRVWE